MTTSSLRLHGFVYLSLWLFCGSAALAQRYVDFSVYRSMKALAPEIPGARLHSGLAPAGYDLWEKGQLRMPAEGLFLTADLRERGKNDRAILLDVPDGKEIATYILIAGEEGGSWSRLFLARLSENTQMRWSAERKAIEIPSAEGIPVSSAATIRWAPGEAPRATTYGYKFDVLRIGYVRWDGQAQRFEYISATEAPSHPWLLRLNLESYSDLEPEKLTGVHIRVTRLRQKGGSPSLFLFSPGYAPNVDFFNIYRRKEDLGHRDQNNRALLLSLSQLREMILTVHGLASREDLWKRTAQSPRMKLEVVLLRVDEDQHFCEVLLTDREARSLESKVETMTGRRKPFGLEER